MKIIFLFLAALSLTIFSVMANQHVYAQDAGGAGFIERNIGAAQITILVIILGIIIGGSITVFILLKGRKNKIFLTFEFLTGSVCLSLGILFESYFLKLEFTSMNYVPPNFDCAGCLPPSTVPPTLFVLGFVPILAGIGLVLYSYRKKHIEIGN